jgi:3-phenylpropionate/cinnamic acid dioxygenase small subunit
MKSSKEAKPAPRETQQASVSLQVLKDVEQFLYREARLLDERRFDDWFALLADDIHYWMPTRFNRMREKNEEDWAIEKELSTKDELAFFDDNKLTLLVRVTRAKLPQVWSEDPPSRTRRFITNIEVHATDNPYELCVHSNFLLRRTRMDTERHEFTGQRNDRLRRVQDSFQIAARRIVLDDTILPSPNLSLFF